MHARKGALRDAVLSAQDNRACAQGEDQQRPLGPPPQPLRICSGEALRKSSKIQRRWGLVIFWKFISPSKSHETVVIHQIFGFSQVCYRDQPFQETRDRSKQERHYIRAAWCVPASCTPQNLEAALKNHLQENATALVAENVTYSVSVTSDWCQSKEDERKFDKVDIGFWWEEKMKFFEKRCNPYENQYLIWWNKIIKNGHFSIKNGGSNYLSSFREF